MLRSAQIQPPQPQHQILPTPYSKRDGIPIAIVQSLRGILAQLEKLPIPLAHLADDGEAIAAAVDVVQGADAVRSHDPFVPREGQGEVGDGEFQVVDSEDLGPVRWWHW